MLHTRRTISICLLAGLACLFTSVSEAGFFKPTWQETYQKIQKEFPKAKQLGADQFSRQFAGTSNHYVLLDIREETEFRISHLSGAINARDTDTALKFLKTTPKDTPIIVYCSVGYRSSATAEELQRAGFQNVQNLKGGIFAWANEGRQIFQGRQKTDKVHPFDSYWSALLNPRYVAKLK